MPMIKRAAAGLARKSSQNVDLPPIASVNRTNRSSVTPGSLVEATAEATAGAAAEKLCRQRIGDR